MPKNPTTPPNDTRKSQRFYDNTNPLWAPKVDKENASPNTQCKRKRAEISTLGKEVEQEDFFYGRTAKGKCRVSMMREVLDKKIEELSQLEDAPCYQVRVMPQPNFDLVFHSLWASNPGFVVPVSSDGVTTEESSEVDSDASSEVSDHDDGFSTPRSMIL